jgi:hypothetical protein
MVTHQVARLRKCSAAGRATTLHTASWCIASIDLFATNSRNISKERGEREREILCDIVHAWSETAVVSAVAMDGQ